MSISSSQISVDFGAQGGSLNIAGRGSAGVGGDRVFGVELQQLSLFEVLGAGHVLVDGHTGSLGSALKTPI